MKFYISDKTATICKFIEKKQINIEFINPIIFPSEIQDWFENFKLNNNKDYYTTNPLIINLLEPKNIIIVFQDLTYICAEKNKKFIKVTKALNCGEVWINYNCEKELKKH